MLYKYIRRQRAASTFPICLPHLMTPGFDAMTVLTACAAREREHGLLRISDSCWSKLQRQQQWIFVQSTYPRDEARTPSPIPEEIVFLAAKGGLTKEGMKNPRFWMQMGVVSACSSCLLILVPYTKLSSSPACGVYHPYSIQCLSGNLQG